MHWVQCMLEKQSTANHVIKQYKHNHVVFGLHMIDMIKLINVLIFVQTKQYDSDIYGNKHLINYPIKG